MIGSWVQLEEGVGVITYITEDGEYVVNDEFGESRLYTYDQLEEMQ